MNLHSEKTRSRGRNKKSGWYHTLNSADEKRFLKIDGRFDCGHFISDGFGDERRCLFSYFILKCDF
uniref:Uncharacterized protein n=1 Tax=Leptospira santarosai serovar Arenal str. MAVJ 401 TaxID=1049976 RepID=M6JQN7_9LEPT|nr:hypothetical protein LEP1GSC063_3498 [Leptospira santarosai serovar Arenal str. MAVJ 401]